MKKVRKGKKMLIVMAIAVIAIVIAVIIIVNINKKKPEKSQCYANDIIYHGDCSSDPDHASTCRRKKAENRPAASYFSGICIWYCNG